MEDRINHIDMGFVAPSKNIIPDQPALQIPGSRLTSYLSEDGELIHPNVALLGKMPTEDNLKDPAFAKVFKQVSSNQKTAVDAFIDNEFRRALPKLSEYKNMGDARIPFIYMGKEGPLFEGLQDVPAGKLPREFAKILRTAVNAFYGTVERITLNIHGTIVEFPVGQQHDEN